MDKPLTIHFKAGMVTAGQCDECHELLDTDRQTIGLILDDKPWLLFHQVCAWKRATFMFGELF
jgi:hypothetical protein